MPGTSGAGALSTRHRILFVSDSADDQGPLLAHLQGDYEVVRVESTMRALGLLGRESFTGVYVASDRLRGAFEFERGAGKSFGVVWAGAEYREFRQAHLDGNIPQVCKGCYR